MAVALLSKRVEVWMNMTTRYYQEYYNILETHDI